MKTLLLILFYVVISCAQTHQYTVSWDRNTEYDMSHYNVFLGASEFFPDSVIMYGTVIMAAVVDQDTTPRIEYVFGSNVDGTYIWAGVQAVDDSLNTSVMGVSAPYKKDDEFAPAMPGIANGINIRK